MMSNGHVIKNTCIAVDYWTPGKFVYFLTHCHADHMTKLTYHWSLPIYTSHCNARWLEEVIKVSKHILQPLNINEEVIIKNPYSKDKFTVTLINARHCPGAVMFYFQGSFGNILYTGDFRYDEQMRTDLILQSIIRKQDVNVLYLDNTYASPACVFPSREEVMEEILDIIRRHPNSHIYIGLRLLGKEEILWNIYNKLKEKVYMNKKRMRLLNTLGLQTDMCTSRHSESRISVVHFNMLTSAWIKDRRREGIDCIGIKPTALFMCLNTANGNSSSSGLYVVPYSDHCSSKELSSFISDLKPEQLFPIIKRKHLGSELNSKRLCEIPAFFYDLCRKGNLNGNDHLCERYKQCLCDQHAPIENCNESVSQKYSNRSCKIQNRRLEKTSHNLGFHSEMRVTGKVPTKIEHHCQTFHADFTKFKSDTELLIGERKELTKLENDTLKQGFIYCKNCAQSNINAVSHACTTEALSSNIVQKFLSNTKKKPIINTFTTCKMSVNKVNTNLNGYFRSSPLYSEDPEKISIERKCKDDHSREIPDFKTKKSKFEVDCDTEPLKDETVHVMQKLRPHIIPENSLPDCYIVFHGIKKLNVQGKAPYRENVSNSVNTTEPLKKRIKISKKLDL